MAMLRIGKLNVRFKDGGLDYLWGEKKGRLAFGNKSAKPDDEYSYNYDDPGYDDRGYDDRDYDPAYDDGAYYDNRGYDDRGYNDPGYDDRGYDDQDYDDAYYGEYGNRYSDRYSDEDADDVYRGDSYQGTGINNFDDLLRYVDENDWVTYLLLVLLPPLGIYLLWRRQRFEPTIRYGISAASLVWFIVLIILLCTSIFGGQNDVQDRNPLPTLLPTQTVEATATPDPAAADANATPAPTPVSGGLFVQPSASPIAGVASSPAPGSLVWASATSHLYHSSDACPTIGTNEVVTQVTIENATARGKYGCPECYGGETYYATDGGQYYHLDRTCSDMQNAEIFTKQQALDAKKKACPVCVDRTATSLDSLATVAPGSPNAATFISTSTSDKSGIKVWCTDGGVNYHMTSNCRGMKGAKQVSLRDAILAGKTACQTCCANSATLVYCTEKGTYYHRTSNCSGMKNAQRVTIGEALVMGKKECSECLSSASVPSGTPAPVVQQGEQSTDPNVVPTKVPQYTWTEEGEKEFGSENLNPETNENLVVPPLADADEHQEEPATQREDTEYYVYATKGGKYYHTKASCSGMSGAKRVTLSSMLAEGRPACPECSGGATTTVYATKGGKYYHSIRTCSGMTNAKSGSLSAALALGYQRCPRCWDNGNSDDDAGNNAGNNNNNNNNNAGSSGGGSTADTVMVYATKNGRNYHTVSTCSGMSGASRISLRAAIEAGKTACSTCASGAQTMVYSTSGGKYYHRTSSCSGMSGATRRTLADALLRNQTACPVCVDAGGNNNGGNSNGGNSNGGNNNNGGGNNNNGNGSNSGGGNSGGSGKNEVGEYEPGKSGVMVWANENGKYFHTKSSCSGASGFSHITLETALNYGKTACPTCAETADDKVYATRSGRYYHNSKSCAGSGAVSGTLADALAYGFKPCPNCVSGGSTLPGGDDSDDGDNGDFNLPESSDTFTPGTSGIKVYAVPGAAYYHVSESHAGSGAKKITLETALNYGMKGCTSCASAGNKTVYASADSFYYHSSKSCEDGTSKGTYAQALAYGLSPCPHCIGDVNEPDVEPGPEYSAPASSSVYVDLYSDQYYYHKNSSCSGSGMSGGTDVTLEYAVDFGFKRCPYCNPASSVD